MMRLLSLVILFLVSWTAHSSQTSLDCLALNIYFEARSEPPEGQLAVAVATLNRVIATDYPDTVCGVVWQSKQFSWTHDGKSDIPKEELPWLVANTVARYAMKHFELNSHDDVLYTHGITHYHADYVHPDWANHMELVLTIGSHKFYRRIK